MNVEIYFGDLNRYFGLKCFVIHLALVFTELVHDYYHVIVSSLGAWQRATNQWMARVHNLDAFTTSTTKVDMPSRKINALNKL